MLSGWLGLSTQSRIDAGQPLTELVGYPRTEISLAGSPHTDVQPRMCGAPDAPSGHTIKYAAVYDDPTPGKGYVLAYWKVVPPLTETPADLPAADLMVTWDLSVLMAVNATAITGSVSACCEPSRSDRLGTVNCQPMYAGVRLSIVGGQILRRGAVRSAPAVAA